MTSIPVSCNLDCGGGCALVATVRDGRVVEVRNNPDRPLDTVGCARGYHAPDALYSTDRIRTPLIRTGPRGSGEFRATGWDEALDVVSSRLSSVIDSYGAEAIFGLAGSGACRAAVHNTSVLTRRFLSCVADGYTGTHSGYSSAAQSFVLPYIFGRSDVGFDPVTLDDSRLIILWGANISDTRFGAGTETVLRRVRAKGVPIICIDPRKSRTVKAIADEWIPINPGTDSALMSAMLYVMIDESLVDADYLDRYTKGFDRLKASIQGVGNGTRRNPDWAEPITGVPAEKIAELARRYAAAKPTALVSGLSIQRAIGGEEAVRLAVALQAATGNIGISGGAPGCCPWSLLPGPRFGRVPSVAEGRKGPSRTVAVYRWPDAILGDEPLDGGPIRAVYIVGANYLVTGSDIEKNIRAFEALDFSVCHEHTLTPTAKYSDVVLPATTYLEREDVTFPDGNYLYYSSKACDPVDESRNDYDIFSELSRRMGVETLFTESRSAGQWLEYLVETSEIEDVAGFKRTGVYDGGDHARIGLAGFIADPDTNRLPTTSGRIELVSAAYAQTGGPEVPAFRGDRPDTHPSSSYPLSLITPHARNRINSTNATAPWANRAEEQRLLMHPVDAKARGVEDGSFVEVESDVGKVRVRVTVSRDIMPGVVSLLAGMWPVVRSHSDDEVSYTGAANLVTSTEPTLPSDGSRTHTNHVEVRPVDEKLAADGQ